MRTLIADAVLAVTTRAIRWIDPDVLDVHLLRVDRPFGHHLPIPSVKDPCVPKATVYISTGYGHEPRVL